MIKRIAPPRAWMMKKVAERSWSLAGLQQLKTLPCPGETVTLRGLHFHLSKVVTQTHKHVCTTLVRVPRGAPVGVCIKQTWTASGARQQSLMGHQCEHCRWDRELSKHTQTHRHTMRTLFTKWRDNTSCLYVCEKRFSQTYNLLFLSSAWNWSSTLWKCCTQWWGSLFTSSELLLLLTQINCKQEV